MTVTFLSVFFYNKMFSYLGHPILPTQLHACSNNRFSLEKQDFNSDCFPNKKSETTMGYRLYLLLLLHIDFTFLQGRSKKIIILQYFLTHRLQLRDLSLFLYTVRWPKYKYVLMI